MLPIPIDFEAAFAALPGSVLLLLPNAPTYTVAGITDELLALLQRPRAAVLGHGVAALYVGDHAAGPAAGLAAVCAALDRALRLKAPADLLPTLFDGPGPAGEAVPQYWAGHTRPVLDAAGAVRYLLHTVAPAAAPTTGAVPTPGPPVGLALPALRSLLLQAPVPILLSSGPEVVIENINAPMLRIIGRASVAEVLGQPLRAVLPHLETEAILTIVRKVVATGQPYGRDEVPIAVPDAAGTRVQHYFNVSYTPLPLSGVPQGVLHMAVDVTAQVRARQQLEASHEARHRP